MTKFYSHYESLNVTRDAPAEVIRAAYRSLSQKHHPDKNTGNQDAAQKMIRLNTAYSVLSDPDQRELYDLQLVHGQYPDRTRHDFPPDVDGKHASAAFRAPAGTPDGPHQNFVIPRLQRLFLYAYNRNIRFFAVLLGAGLIALLAVMYMLWRENQSALRIEGAAFQTVHADQAAPAIAAPAPAGPAASAAATPKSSAEPLKSAAAPKAPAAPKSETKASEYERLTAMLKSMGFGLHKLDVPTLASKDSSPRSPAKAERPTKETPPPTQAAAKAATPSDAGRAREDAERTITADTPRSETKAVPAASQVVAPPAPVQNTASASQAPRPAVLVDGRASCPSPPYPMNAYRNGESGSVLVALLVGSEGRVLESKVQKSSGSTELDKVARKALTQCKFKPTGNDAEPVWTTLTFVWTID